MDPISIIPQLLRAIARIAQAPAIKRNDIYIRTLKQLRLDPKHPPADFDGVYAYALVEYALAEGSSQADSSRSETMLRLFAEPKVKEAFHESYKQWDGAAFQAAIAREINPAGYHDGEWQDWTQRDVVDAEWRQWSGSNVIGVAIADEETDVQQEVTVFFSVLLDVVRRSQTPKEQMQTVMIASIQQNLQELRTQLAQVPNLDKAKFEALTDAVADKLQARLQRLLPGSPEGESGEQPYHSELAQQLDEWFQVLGYGRESHSVVAEKYFEWMITIPVRRRRYDRIVVRGVTGEAGLSDLQGLQAAVEQHQADEGWLVSSMRVSSGARKAAQENDQYEALTCYTLDELLDEDADFSQYLEWLEAEIKQRGIDQGYIPLGCRKDEIDPNSQQKIGISHYGEEEGWIEGYVEQWLADPAKEHLSVLGEFGTGKTWFALHYAWLSLQQYQEAKKKRVERPRLPLVIPLRDYAKAVSVESLFSEFFFRKHEIPLPGYTAFEQLNRMGKLLLIFDGFDEMAARINQQAMIDNFWELSKAVVPGAKAILTCRTEHFPNAMQGRRL
ncbi:MAG: NACHT domain-containing protein, partial [Leptolyngbyaceae cyanobacterium]